MEVWEVYVGKVERVKGYKSLIMWKVEEQIKVRIKVG